MQSNDYIIQGFEKNFAFLKKENIAIYGTGITAQVIIENFRDYNIIGLIDSMKTGQIFLGKRVLGIEEVLEQGAHAIILAARAASVKIIYARIKEVCKRYGTPIFDMNGTDLTRKYESDGCDEERPAECEFCVEDLKKLIDEHEVISFDIFDTLLMRKTMAPTDIFMEMKWQDKRVPDNFPQERVNAEFSLNQTINPQIEDIYEKLQQLMGLSEEEREFLMHLERETEQINLIRREEIVDAYQYALKKEKDVYIVSDMYYGREILIKWLEGLGISGYNDLLVSCDYGVNKDNGLFEKLKERIGEKSCLHIGDNENADIVAAQKAGFDAFHILRGTELIQLSTHIRIVEMLKSNYANKRVLGLYIAQVFNSPFVLHGQTRPKMASAYELGKALLGPVVTKYMLWLFREIRKEQLEYLIFPLRDGYLFEKLYQCAIDNSSLNWPKAVTIEASRKACVLAGIQGEEDIKDTLMVLFNDSPENLLKTRFELKDEEILEWKNEDKVEYVLKHASVILERAKKYRKWYREYLVGQGLEPSKRIGFFEFISRGTCHKYLEKILGTRLKGFYWSGIDVDRQYLTGIEVKSLYPAENMYQDDKALFEYQLWLESVFTAYTPSFYGFTEELKKKYYPETRTQGEIQQLRVMHDGIIDFWKEYAGNTAIEALLEREEMDLEFVDWILGCVSSQKTEIPRELQEIRLVDEYCSVIHENSSL